VEELLGDTRWQSIPSLLSNLRETIVRELIAHWEAVGRCFLPCGEPSSPGRVIRVRQALEERLRGVDLLAQSTEQTLLASNARRKYHSHRSPRWQLHDVELEDNLASSIFARVSGGSLTSMYQ
jgi:hypothetical protein